MKKIMLWTNKYKDYIFIIPFIIVLNLTALTLTTKFFEEYSRIIGIIKYACLSIIMIKIIVCDAKNYTRKTIIKCILGIILTLIIGKVTDDRSFFQFFILIIGAYKVDFNKIIKWSIISEGILLFTIVILSLLGVIPNIEYGRANSEVIRYSLGFKYPTYPAVIFLGLTMLYLILKKDKIKLWEYGIILIINIALYVATNTRTEMACVVILIIMNYIYNKKIIKINEAFRRISKIIFIICALASIIIAGLYIGNEEKYQWLNNALSGRLKLTQSAIENYGIDLFGNKIEWVGLSDIKEGTNTDSEFNMIDNSYLNLLIVYGVIAFITIIYLYSNTSKAMKYYDNGFINCCMIIIAINGLLNPILIRMTNNIFMLLFSYIVIENKEKTKEYLSNKEIQTEDAKMLKTIIEYCNKHNITYYLCGGTLLGAIRHKGFIPWDDDIDIIMPRPEYDKFEKLVKKDNYKIEELEINAFEFGNLNKPFIKVNNPNIIIDNHFLEDEYEKNLWIDIFPMDGLPEDDEKCKKIFRKSLFLRKVLSMITVKDSVIIKETKNKATMPAKFLVRIFLRNEFGYRLISKKIIKNSKKYQYDKCEYVGGSLWGYGPQERMKKENMKSIIVEFEGIKANTFACYDEYLTNLYGDYMQLPPVEKRIVHNIKAYKIKEQ